LTTHILLCIFNIIAATNKFDFMELDMNSLQRGQDNAHIRILLLYLPQDI